MVASGITLAMIVKDEAAFLPQCLASVRDWVQAMVVVDTGSTDGTPEIARAAGATVISTVWTGDFSAARNVASDAVNTPWTLVLDADETLVAADGPLLHQRVRHPTADAYNLRVISLADQAEHLSEAYVTRLFRTDPRIRWSGRVHEQIIPQLQRHGLTLELAPIRILHTGYLPAVMEARHKAERNRQLLEQELAAKPGDPYTLWQLGQTVIQNGEIELALRYCRKAEKRLPLRHPLRPLIWITRVKAHIAAQDWRRAHTQCVLGLQEWPTYTDLEYFAGQVAMQMGQLDEAVQRFHRAYDLGVPHGYLQTETGVSTYKPLWGLVQCMHRLQQPTKVVAYLLLLLKTAPAFRPGWRAFSELYANVAVADAGQQLLTVLTAVQIADTMALWSDPTIWEMALGAWARHQCDVKGAMPRGSDSPSVLRTRLSV